MAYKALRAVEMEAFRRLGELPVPDVRLERFFGLEVDDFACQTARLGLWITEYRVNEGFRRDLGKAPPALPLTAAGRIIHDNAARADWLLACPADEASETFVVGYPPFKGAKHQNDVVPPEARSDDAVKLMTIHASKGLEFAAVHLPMASSRHIPMAHRPSACPPPPDLARLDVGPVDHDAEERCLWFVAMSRARDHLTISHAARYGRRDARPSPYLARIGPTDASSHPAVAEDEGARAPAPLAPRSVYPDGDLATYVRCPMRYRHEVVDGLAEVLAPSGHARFRRAIHAAVRALEEGVGRHSSGPTYEQAAGAMTNAWAVHGPVEHPQERFYRDAADRAMTRMAEVVASEVGATYDHEDWAVAVGAGIVVTRPHRVVVHPWDAVTVQVLRPHRRGHAGDHARHALLWAGARARFPDLRVNVETLDPETGDVDEPYLLDEDDALAPYRDAMAGFEAGVFTPSPGQRCPSCPFFFVCGA